MKQIISKGRRKFVFRKLLFILIGLVIQLKAKFYCLDLAILRRFRHQLQVDDWGEIYFLVQNAPGPSHYNVLQSVEIIKKKFGINIFEKEQIVTFFLVFQFLHYGLP